ncbi:hypothetical protein CGLO_13407 [Colletotrichum gloeosporioides Cg-14]|jgi:hypothetical protein
MTLEQ